MLRRQLPIEPTNQFQQEIKKSRKSESNQKEQGRKMSEKSACACVCISKCDFGSSELNGQLLRQVNLVHHLCMSPGNQSINQSINAV
jgi:hypothetical protein